MNQPSYAAFISEKSQTKKKHKESRIENECNQYSVVKPGKALLKGSLYIKSLLLGGASFYGSREWNTDILSLTKWESDRVG